MPDTFPAAYDEELDPPCSHGATRVVKLEDGSRARVCDDCSRLVEMLEPATNDQADGSVA